MFLTVISQHEDTTLFNNKSNKHVLGALQLKLLPESQLCIFSLLIILIFIFEGQLSLIAVNVKYFYFAFRNSFCNIQPFLKILFRRKSIKLLKLEVPLFSLFYKIEIFGTQFSVCFVSFESISSISKNLFFCFILVPLNMSLQKCKEKQKH